MASIKNLKALNWDVIHYANVAPPAWPDELTDAWWKKKRSLLSKTVDTGLGKVLRAAEADFKKLDFQPVGGRNWKEIEEGCKAALASAAKDGKKAQEIFKDVRDAAKKASKTLADKKFKKDAKIAADISTWADGATVTFGKNSLQARIAETRLIQRQKIFDGQKKNMANVVKLAGGVAKKVTSGMPAARKAVVAAFAITDEREHTTALSKAADTLRTFCRDMSQPAVNFLKAHDMGIEMDPSTFDERAVRKFKEDIGPLANSQSQMEIVRGKDEADVLLLCDDIEAFAVRFARDIQVIRLPQV